MGFLRNWFSNEEKQTNDPLERAITTRQTTIAGTKTNNFLDYKPRRRAILVITRKRGESILIGKDIKITVCEVVNGKVRIGIDAPKDIAIHRKEIAERFKPKPGDESDGTICP